MSAAAPLDYADRCERYARQRGWAYDPKRLSIGHLTPAQHRRALHKERHADAKTGGPWSRASYKAGTVITDAAPWPCDVCGLPDPYQGTGDGIGSCGCPRCECGEAAHSAFCTCLPDDYLYDYDEYDREPDVAAEVERRFLGDLPGWKPTGLHQPEAP